MNALDQLENGLRGKKNISKEWRDGEIFGAFLGISLLIITAVSMTYSIKANRLTILKYKQ